jgi:hypothetical protein
MIPSGTSVTVPEIRKHVNADRMRTFAIAVLMVGMCHSATTSSFYVNPRVTSNAYSTFTRITVCNH